MRNKELKSTIVGRKQRKIFTQPSRTQPKYILGLTTLGDAAVDSFQQALRWETLLLLSFVTVNYWLQ